MITLIIALGCAAGVGTGFYFGDIVGLGWSIFFGIVAFAGVQLAFGLHFRKRVKADMDIVQGILVSGQKEIEAKTRRWQFRPPSSLSAAQAEIGRDQRKLVFSALDATAALEKYVHWVPMMSKQIATARLQLYWMAKEYAKCDELFPKALYADPSLWAMRLARLQMRDRPLDEMAKIYAKGARRLRYNQNVLLAATWSWIQVKRGDADGAFKTLTQALKNSDNAVLKANHEALANNRVSHFTNSNIGDTWYAMGLEEPRLRAPRQHVQWR